MIDGTAAAGSRSVIHYVDVEQVAEELRPVCGAWGDEVTWTTIVSVATCPDCALALRRNRPAANRSFRSRRAAGT